MITKKEAEKLREMIGKRHITQISKYLLKNKLYNKDNDPYSTSYITRIFNAIQGVENEILECHIWNCAAERLREAEAEKLRREELMRRFDEASEENKEPDTNN